MNVFLKADEIINQRGEEKERQYGPIDESLESTAKLASILLNKSISIDDIYIILTCLKLARLRVSYKEDSILDAIAYLGAYNNYKQKKMNLDLDSVITAEELLNKNKSKIDEFVKNFKARHYLAIGKYKILFGIINNKIHYITETKEDKVFCIIVDHIKQLLSKQFKLEI